MDITDGKYLELCLKNVMRRHNIVNFKCEIENVSKNTDGFLGEIVYLRVLDQEKNKTLKFVVKCSKTNKELRAALPIKNIFLNEKFVYKTLIPALRNFQIERCVESVFSAVPKFYGTFISEDIEMIVLENLENYKLWDKTVPMNIGHVKRVLEEYGNVHAISFAIKHQDLDLFQQLSNKSFDLAIKQYIFDDLTYTIKTNFELFSEIFKNEEKIWKKLQTLDNEIVDLFQQIYFEPNDNVVFCHGDCWNNNFMFEYETDETSEPTNLAIIDWQMCRIMSPVIDISYFLYSTISQEQLKNNFDELLKIYYDSFSMNLKSLGSDPEMLYSFKQFQADWKKYAKYGLIILPTVLKICTSDNQDIGDETENGLRLNNIFLCQSEDKTSSLCDRFKHVVEHFVERDFF